MASMKKLTARQQRFVEEYLIDLNASKACVRAGYSPKNADVTGPDLIGKPWVAEAVRQGKERLSKIAGRSAADVLADIGRVRADAMQEVTDERTGTKSMLSHKDALKALELEGKHLGAFVDRVEVTGKDRGPVQTLDVSKLSSEALSEIMAAKKC